MRTTRRQVLRFALGSALALGSATLTRAQSSAFAPSSRVFVPLAIVPPEPTAGPATGAEPLPPATATAVPAPSPTAIPAPSDLPILGPASGSVEQAIAWIEPRTAFYVPYDVAVIVQAYRTVGEQAGIDWFLALAQMCHETGSLTSFWSSRPQRNPAGIGVTGQFSETPPDDPAGWAFNTQRMRWETGVSFPTWANHGVPAQLGRLLAYALTDAEANPTQRELITLALQYRPLSADRRGSARSWYGLDGRWAVPGNGYGARIIELAGKIRGE
jgi:hypothetical protein